MDRTLTVHCDDDLAREIASLARSYGITEREVARQLLEIGLDEVRGLERSGGLA